jgi:hypothetical protein
LRAIRAWPQAENMRFQADLEIVAVNGGVRDANFHA